MYAIKNSDNYETCHHDFNFHSHDNYFVEFAPTTIDEKKFAYVESKKILCLCIMKHMARTFKPNPLPMHRDFVSKQLMGTRIN